MADRYFVDEPISPGPVELTGPEAHHLIHVMRAAPGTEVVLFDGAGGEFPAVVQRVKRDRVELSAVARHAVSRELPVAITLGVTLPKGDRQKWLVEKAVELGVARVVPLRTHRAVAQPVEQALRRLRRSVVEASKQCGRNRLMAIAEPLEWSDFVAGSADISCRLLAHPQVRSQEEHDMPTTSVGMSPISQPGDVYLAVGPEGGFTGDEVALAVAAGWRPVDLGPRILRIETAAILLAAMVAAGRPTSPAAM
jgi:16S rRNA (uracil1498-N3)-methyltransferase